MSMMNEINAELQVLAAEEKAAVAEFQYEEMQAEYWGWFMGMVERYERDMEIMNA